MASTPRTHIRTHRTPFPSRPSKALTERSGKVSCPWATTSTYAPVLITERYEDDSYRYVMGKYFPTETYQNWQVDDETHLKRLIKSWGISRVKFKEVVWMNESHDEHKQRQLMYMVGSAFEALVSQYPIKHTAQGMP